MFELMKRLRQKDLTLLAILLLLAIMLVILYHERSRKEPVIVYDSTQKNYYFPPDRTQFPNKTIPQIDPEKEDPRTTR